jgi:hypothetical protein
MGDKKIALRQAGTSLAERVTSKPEAIDPWLDPYRQTRLSLPIDIHLCYPLKEFFAPLAGWDLFTAGLPLKLQRAARQVPAPYLHRSLWIKSSPNRPPCCLSQGKALPAQSPANA